MIILGLILLIVGVAIVYLGPDARVRRVGHVILFIGLLLLLIGVVLLLGDNTEHIDALVRAAVLRR